MNMLKSQKTLGSLINFVIKSNSLRRTAKDKMQQLTDLSAKLDDAVKK